MQIISAGGLLPETMTQCRRIVADGGTIVDQRYMDRIIRTMKAQGIYTSAKYIGDANIAVKKDGSNAVSTLYDISGNNNDAVQATGSKQPIWTAAQQNGKPGLVFDGVDDYLETGANVDLSGAMSALCLFTTPNSDPDGAGQFLLSNDPVNVVGAQLFITHKQYTNRMSVDYYNGGYRYATTTETCEKNLTYLLSAVRDNGLATSTTAIWKNGTAQTVTMTGAYAVGETANHLFIGGLSRTLTGYFWKKGILNVSIFNTNITTAQRQAMENVLNNYYAIY